MTCTIVTHEIAFTREVADQIYLMIEDALSVVMTSPTDCGEPRWGSLRLFGTDSAIPPVAAASESRLAFRARSRGRADGKVILPRPRIEFFDLLDLVPRRPAHGPFLRFDHSTCGF